DSTCFEGADWTLDPNGTGPFKLSEFVLGQRIVLESNPDYHLDPKPSLQQVTYVLSGGSALVMYENDEIDLTGVGINDIERIRDPGEPLNAEFQESEQLDTFYIGFNVEEPPFDDARVRQALSMAIDKEAIASSILIDLVTPANGILPPGMPGYNEGLTGLPYDPDEARRILDEAGGPEVLDGATILASGAGASPGPVLDAIVALWEQELGAVIEIEQEETGLFFRDIKEGNFKISSQGWVADYQDPHNFLDLQFHSQSPLNDTHYSNAEVDALLEQARSEKDATARLDLYQQAEEIIVEDAAWIPLSHSKASVLIKPYVQGYVIPPFVIPNLRYVSISR
ncbi:MAG TPA: peptide ABC transporter substrate-binding protein, partial [Dehalococcoidia bacterium]|nr:peptide ABC transporter substrate-binding protein [Dehalococcoidia bacterium]